MVKKMEKRHSPMIRICHWTNMIAITMLVLTGFYIHGPLDFSIFDTMDGARYLHFLFAYILCIGVVLRVYYAIVADDAKNLVFNPVKDTKNFPSMIAYYTFLTDSHPDYGKYNPGQKMMYTGWLFMALIQIFTGFILLFPLTFAGIASALGGLIVVRIVHLVVTWLFVLSVMMHVYLDLSEGFPVLMSMFTGKIPVGFHGGHDEASH